MALIHGMFDSGALPAAERLVQFTAERQKVLAANVANLSTPYYKARDLDTRSFQRALGEAIDRRRGSVSPTRGPLEVEDTRQLRFRADGMDARPQPTNENILYHDQNNRDLERLMQRVAENTMAGRLGVELVRNQLGLIRTAISERIA